MLSAAAVTWQHVISIELAFAPLWHFVTKAATDSGHRSHNVVVKEAPAPALARRGSGGRGAAAAWSAAPTVSDPAAAASCNSAELNMPLMAAHASRVLTVTVGSSIAQVWACQQTAQVMNMADQVNLLHASTCRDNGQ